MRRRLKLLLWLPPALAALAAAVVGLRSGQGGVALGLVVLGGGLLGGASSFALGALGYLAFRWLGTEKQLEEQLEEQLEKQLEKQLAHRAAPAERSSS